MWPLVFSWVKEHKNIVLGSILFLCSLFVVSVVKDKIYAAKIATQDKYIMSLTTDINTLKGQKTEQEKETKKAVDLYNKEKQVSQLAQKKVDLLIKERETSVSTNVSFSSVDDCVTELKLEREKYKQNEDVYIAEIQQDRTTIAAGEQVIQAQKVELTTANEIITKNSQLVSSLELKVDEIEKQMQVEADRKKRWRTAAIVEAVVIVLLAL